MQGRSSRSLQELFFLRARRGVQFWLDDHEGHLLARPVLLCGCRRPRPHVGFILREQGMHQTHKLASGEDEGTLVSVFGDFVVLAPVIGLVLHSVLSDLVSSLDEVVASVRVADFSKPGVLRDEVAGGAPFPSDPKMLSEVLILREARDVDDLSEQATGDDGAEAWDGDDGIGHRVDGAGDVLVKSLLGALDEADVIELGGQGGSEHLISLRGDGIGRAQGSLDSTSFGVRIIEVASATFCDQVGQLVVGHIVQFGSSELSE